MFTEIKQALGSWSIRLTEDTPKEILDSLDPFGHIAILPGKVNPSLVGDNLLNEARYVGVYRGRANSDDITLKGAGMAFWLGDEDDKGDVFTTPVPFSNETFANTIRGLLPPSGAITEGTIHSVPGTYTGTHRWETPRKALTYVTGVFSTEAHPVSWRVNNNGTLDAGRDEDLFVTTPKAILVKKQSGREMFLTGLRGNLSLESDVEDYTTKVVLLAEGEGDATQTATKSLPAVPFKDLHGNTINQTRLISESTTEASNADARAQLQLNRFSNPRYAVDLSTDEYDVKGEFQVGDIIYVFDPEAGFVDEGNEVYWQGQPINPMALRVTELSWPLPSGWTVAFRRGDGTWLDLSDHYLAESGSTSVRVGSFSSVLAPPSTEPVGSRPVGDRSVPATPTFTGFSPGSYQSGTINTTKSAIRCQWTTPLNIDGSTVLDGDHYELRYRVSAVIGYQVDWDTLGSYSWDDLGTWDALISEPVQASPEFQTAYAGWDANAYTITELTPGVTYEIQIRAVDAATPPNFSAWSASEFVTTVGDLIAPSQPAAPEVAASRIALQVKHFLGKNSGGVFNLEQDLDHLDVHVGGSNYFFCDDTNKVGELLATAGMLQTQIPALGTFSIEQTDTVWVRVVAVDRSGNKSSASPGVQASALLIDNAHVSDLSVSKLTAGTITAQSVLAAELEIGAGGNIRVTDGSFDAYDSQGNKRIEVGQLNDGTFDLAAYDPATGTKVNLAQLAFGLKADTEFSAITVPGRSDNNYDFVTDLDYPGPFVRNVLIGDSRQCLVFMSANIMYNANGSDVDWRTATMSFRIIDDVTGQEVWEPSVGYGLSLDSNRASITASHVVLLPPYAFPVANRTYTFEGRYQVRAFNNKAMIFQSRRLIVMPY